MKILLIGEYSRLHNSLKEGLLELNHDVILVGMNDAFKKFPVDYSYTDALADKPYMRLLNKACIRFLKYDLNSIERGIRFLGILPKLKNYDVVQLVNETPIQTIPWIEKKIIKKIIKKNKKTFLLSCGADHLSVKYASEGHFRYSVFDLIAEDASLKDYFSHPLRYLKPELKKLSDFLYQHINGTIASDFDYVIPLQNNPKFLGLIANPINISKLQVEPLVIQDKIIIFLGINKNARIKKGIPFFEKALEIIQQKYPEKVEIIITEDLPYSEYINIYNRCHILLDQIYAYDQGFNALEAMAKGKVVFTGAEKEFLEYYGLKEDEVAINTLPDVDYLVEKLSELIQSPQKIIEISENAKAFIQREHHYIKIAQKYLDTWNKH